MKSNERLKEVIKDLGINKNQFAKSLNRTFAGIYDVLSTKGGRVGISKSLAQEIVRVYPQYNLNWLLTGDGEMLKSEVKTSITSTNPDTRVAELEQKVSELKVQLEVRIAEFEQKVASLQREVQLLREIKEKDNQLIQEKDKMIALLEKQQQLPTSRQKDATTATEQGEVGSMARVTSSASRNITQRIGL